MADGHLKNSANGHLVFGPAAGHLADECVAGTSVTCNCTSAPDNTYPRLKITMCWTDADVTKSFLACTYTNGESKSVCPYHYDTTTEEDWIAKGTAFSGSPSDRFRIVSNTGIIVYTYPSSAVISGNGAQINFRWSSGAFNLNGHKVATGTKAGTTLQTKSLSAHNISMTAFPATGTSITTEFFGGVGSGSITTNTGVTIKWAPISGSGKSWASWKNTGLSYVPATGNESCP